MKKLAVLIVVLLTSICYGVADSNLVAWYKLDDNADSNVVVDSIGDYNGTFCGNAGSENYTSAHDVTGKIGGALEFDGTNDYVDTGNDYTSIWNSRNFTISTWFYPRSENFFICGEEIASETLSIKNTTSSGLRCYYETNQEQGLAVVQAGIVTLNKWLMVTMAVSTVNNVTTISVYMNAALIGNVSGETTNTTRGHSNLYLGDFNIGGEPEGVIPFNGSLDDFRIFGKALDSQEIAVLYLDGILDSNYVHPEDVRAGTVYEVNDVNLIGTLDLPDANNVKYGTKYDNDTKTGTCKGKRRLRIF